MSIEPMYQGNTPITLPLALVNQLIDQVANQPINQAGELFTNVRERVLAQLADVTPANQAEIDAASTVEPEVANG